MHRVGIIPFDTKEGAIAVLFVTSQTRGRWILPKGRQEEGETHHDTCHREGFEEAGVRGVVLGNFPMTVSVTRQTTGTIARIPVTYYPFLVTEQVDDWPERKKRQRHWALIEDASRVAYREDLLGLIRQFDDLSDWIREAAEQHRTAQQEPLMPAL